MLFFLGGISVFNIIETGGEQTNVDPVNYEIAYTIAKLHLPPLSKALGRYLPEHVD